MREYSEIVPVQYEDKKADFMGFAVYVDPRVLIPRPETELLVRQTARLLKSGGVIAPKVLDLCTGSGIIAVGLKKIMPGCRITASDISEEALFVAAVNLRDHGLDKEVELISGDMFGAVSSSHERQFDCIVSNPPYVSDKDYGKLDAWVRAEPKVALWSGTEGMDHLKIIAEEGKKFLSDEGFIAVEVGYDQSKKTQELFLSEGFGKVEVFKDFNGVERIVVGYQNG